MIGKTVAKKPYMNLVLNNNVTDTGTGANTPTNSGVTFTTDQFGRSNMAGNWDAASDNLEMDAVVGNKFSEFINSNGATFTAFIAIKNITDTFASIFNQFESGGTNRSFNLQFNINEQCYASLYPGGSGFNWSDIYGMTIDQFQHIVYKFKKNGSNVDGELFVDGASRGTTSSLDVPKEDSSLKTRIGAVTGGTRGDLGKANNFRIYDVTLSDGQIKIINNEKGRIALPKKLLLDTYTGASVAYSLRKLRYSYNGSAIRVRRSSDNTEQDIGFVNNQLDTSALTTFCTGTNGFVVTWYDQSTTGKNVTQSTAANQPQIVSSGSVLTDNSKPCITFDGANDGLITSSSVISGTTHRTSFTVANADTANNDDIFYSFGDISSTGKLYMLTAESAVRVSGSVTFLSSAQSSQSVATCVFNGTTTSDIDLWVNGTSKTINTSTATTINTASTNFRVGYSDHGSGHYYDGILQEVILYATDQTSNRSAIESNINTYYGVY